MTPLTWGLADDNPGGLTLQGLPLADLLRKWGSPLYVMDAHALRDNARRFMKPHGTPSGCEFYYSYKTHPVPWALDVLHAEGIGAEVISHYELWLARRLGVPAERIVYNGPGKSIDSIREAIEIGVQIMNINHRKRSAVSRRCTRRGPQAARRPARHDRWRLDGPVRHSAGRWRGAGRVCRKPSPRACWTWSACTRTSAA